MLLLLGYLGLSELILQVFIFLHQVVERRFLLRAEIIVDMPLQIRVELLELILFSLQFLLRFLYFTL